MKRKYILLITILAVVVASFGQTTILLDDSTTVFKNQEGKLLNKAEVQDMMKTKFSMRQDIVDGKKIITIIPTAESEMAKYQAKMKAFKENLVGKPVTAFRLTDINSKKWDSKKLKGKVVVINFWFTTCKPCIQEMPLLNELAEANKDSVIFLAPAPDKEEQVKKFLAKYKFDYNIIASATDYIDKLNIENFPTHLVIDKEGIIRQVFIGYSNDIKVKLQEEINKLTSK